MKKYTLIVFALLTVIIVGCTQSIGTPRPTLVSSNPMDMIAMFARQTAAVQTQTQVAQLPPPQQTQFAVEYPFTATLPPPEMNPMDLIAKFAGQTMAARTQVQVALTSTPPSPTPHPQFVFVIITQDGVVFGFDANGVLSLPQQTVNVEGVDYRGATLYDVLSSVDSVKFGIKEIELQGDTTFTYGFDQISNENLISAFLTQNSAGGFDVISSSIPKENWVANIKVIRIK